MIASLPQGIHVPLDRYLKAKNAGQKSSDMPAMESLNLNLHVPRCSGKATIIELMLRGLGIHRQLLYVKLKEYGLD